MTDFRNVKQLEILVTRWFTPSRYFLLFFESYADEREQMDREAQMTRGKFEPIATIDEKRISAVLKTPWATDGKDFSAV